MYKKVFDVNSFVQNLNLKIWFSKCGQNTITSTNNLKYANSLTNTILIWDNNSENRNDEWEKLRVKVLKNETWLSEFNNIKIAAATELKKNSHFNKFINNTKTTAKKNIKYTQAKNITDFEIVNQLPILGYFGETLLNNNSFKYYTNEIALFKKGHFVCENLDNKFLIY